MKFAADDSAYSYDALLRRGWAAGQHLTALSVTAGDRVAIFADNCVGFLDYFFGAQSIGAIAVPINVNYRGELLRHILTVTEPALVLYCEHVNRDPLTLADAAQVPLIAMERVGDTSSGPSADRSDTKAGDVAWLALTSGTTGRSKAVACTHASTLAFADIAKWSLAYSADDALYTCLPLFHSNALVTSFFGGLLAGTSLFVDTRFSLSGYWPAIRSSRATFTNLIGSMTALLVGAPENPDEHRHHLRGVLRSGSPELVPKFEARFGVSTTEMYGLTDAGLPTATPPARSRPRSCGPVSPGYAAQILDVSTGAPLVGPGQGELQVRELTPGVMPPGYWGPNGEVFSHTSVGGWFATGDLMERDADGWFYFLGRLKDVIRKSGENVAAADIESALTRHPSVEEAAAFAVPSDLGEDEIMVAVQKIIGIEVTADELRDFCEEALPYFAVPRFYRFVDRLPRNDTLKVATQTLRAEAVTTDTFDTGDTGQRATRARRNTRGSAATRKSGDPVG